MEVVDHSDVNFFWWMEDMLDFSGYSSKFYNMMKGAWENSYKNEELIWKISLHVFLVYGIWSYTIRNNGFQICSKNIINKYLQFYP